MRFSSFIHRLNLKIILGVVSTLFIGAVVLLYLLYTFNRNQLIEGLKTSTNIQGDLIKNNLKIAMLTKHPTYLPLAVHDLAKEEGVDNIFILDKKGIIKVSADMEQVGKGMDKASPTCQLCHRLAPESRAKTVIFTAEKGYQVLRNVSPIFNSPECYGCHSPADRINGVLVMDFSLAGIQGQLLSNVKKMFYWTLIMVLGMIGMLSLLMNRLVLRKIKDFVRATKSIGEGKLDEEVHIKGRDEISQLAYHFDQMRVSLKESMGEIKRNKEYLENLINSVDDGIVVVDRDYRIVIANEAYAAHFGWTKDEVRGETCYAITRKLEGLCHQISACPAQRTFLNGKLEKTIHTVHDRDGKEHTMEIYSSPLKDEKGEVFQVVEVWRDITERKHLEAYLSHSERLASLGLLASGIAHEINNPLASIATCIEGLQRRVGRSLEWNKEAQEEIAEYLGLIQKETQRCKGITEKLLIMSRKSRAYLDFLDVNRSLSETISLLEFEAKGNNIKIERDFSHDLPLIKGDESQLRQVFLNIILNGIQAIGRDGTVRVTTRWLDGIVRISIEDTGCGIEKKDLQRIFEPFFTGRPLGRGTGLGLFIANSIVRQHRGEISVESQPGQGTRFTILLPGEPEASWIPG